MTNPNEYRPLSYLPKFDAGEIEGDETVLTILEAEERRGEYGPFLSIQFEEFPGQLYITNKSQAWALMQASNAKKLPPNVNEWVGYRVPMCKQFNQNPKNGEVVAKLYAMGLGRWDAALAEYDTMVYGRPMPAYFPTAGERGRMFKEAHPDLFGEAEATPKPKAKRKSKAKAK